MTVYTYDVHFAPGQQDDDGISGLDVDRHIKEIELLKHCFSVEDELIQYWRKNPREYPEKFRQVIVCLWKSQRTEQGVRKVACLYWRGGQVFVMWIDLNYTWDHQSPLLVTNPYMR